MWISSQDSKSHVGNYLHWDEGLESQRMFMVVKGWSNGSGSLFITFYLKEIIPPDLGQSWGEPDRMNDCILLFHLPA